MKSIYTLTLFVFLLLSGVVARAQDVERLESLKIAYLTKKLNLSSEEAQKFWPVYNSYISDLRKVRFDSRGTNELDREEKMLGVRKKYQSEFSRVLSPDKANEFYRAEKDFNNYVQKELMERRQQRGQGGGNPGKGKGKQDF